MAVLYADLFAMHH